MTGALGRVRSAAVLLLVAAPLALAACAGTGYHYVKSTEDKTYFKVPESWKLYDEESVLGALKGALSKDEITQRRDTTWTTVFDANPDPSLNHVASKRPNYPSAARSSSRSRLKPPTARRSSRCATSSSTSTRASTAERPP